MPWLGVLIGRISPVRTGRMQFIARCKGQAASRLQRGATNPDLFYYLVSKHASPSGAAP